MFTVHLRTMIIVHAYTMIIVRANTFYLREGICVWRMDGRTDGRTDGQSDVCIGSKHLLSNKKPLFYLREGGSFRPSSLK